MTDSYKVFNYYKEKIKDQIDSNGNIIGNLILPDCNDKLVYYILSELGDVKPPRYLNMKGTTLICEIYFNNNPIIVKYDYDFNLGSKIITNLMNQKFTDLGSPEIAKSTSRLNYSLRIRSVITTLEKDEERNLRIKFGVSTEFNKPTKNLKHTNTIYDYFTHSLERHFEYTEDGKEFKMIAYFNLSKDNYMKLKIRRVK